MVTNKSSSNCNCLLEATSKYFYTVPPLPLYADTQTHLLFLDDKRDEYTRILIVLFQLKTDIYMCDATRVDKCIIPYYLHLGLSTG